jgi:hypothetical protein
VSPLAGVYEHRNFPELTWSLSRDTKLRECKYKYYHHFYESHNGWLRTCTLSQRKSYLLKQLKGVHSFFGESLHKMAEHSLNQYKKSKIMPGEEVLSKGVSNMLNRAFVDSRTNKSKWELKPKDYVMLSEIYYNNSLDKKTIDVILDRKNKCISNFVNCQTIQDITNTDVKFIEIEQLNNHILFDIKNFVKIDCLYLQGREQDGVYKIIDWKTGHEDNEKIFHQLCIYGLYLTKVYGVTVNRIEIVTEYLLTGRRESHFLEKEDLDRILIDVEQSIEEMKFLCADPKTNQPKELSAFEPCPTKMCKFCEFREVCPYEYSQ